MSSSMRPPSRRSMPVKSREKEAFLVNGDGAGNLARAAASAGAMLVHYSTDYVFDGQKKERLPRRRRAESAKRLRKIQAHGRNTDTRALPESLDSAHVLALRPEMEGISSDTIVNAARKGNPLRVVNDQKGAPRIPRILPRITLMMIEAGCRSTYHVTNSGSLHLV